MWVLRKTLTYSLRVHGEYNNVLRATANVLDYWKHNATIYSHSARRCIEDDSILAANENLRTSKCSNGLALQNNIWSLVSVRGCCSFISTPQTDLQISPSELLAAQAGYAAQRVQGKKMDLTQRVTNMHNEDRGMMVLAGDVFDVPIRKDIVHRVVRWQLAKRQQGTHSTKTISEVSGTGKKPWKQKGTGRARHGSLRGPQFRHGATMHGPKPRSHAIKLQKKVRRLGLKVALSARAAEGKLMIFDNLDLPSHKTKEVVKYVSELNCKKILLVDGGPINQNLRLATQNLHYANILPSIGLNVYSILQHDTLVMTVDAVNRIVKRLHTPINR